MFNLPRFKSKIEERNKAVRAASRQIEKHGRDYITTSFKKVFEKYPQLKCFSWDQGQYYNDQDFDWCCNNESDQIRINNDQVSEYGELEGSSNDPDADNDWVEEAAEEICDILSFLTDDDYQESGSIL